MFHKLLYAGELNSAEGFEQFRAPFVLFLSGLYVILLPVYVIIRVSLRVLVCALAGLSDAHGHLSVGDRRDGQRAASGTVAARPLRAAHEKVPCARLPSPRGASLLLSILFIQ